MNLPFTQKEEWVYRWLVLRSWKRLHRVQEIGDPERFKELVVNIGKTVCGLKGKLAVPGIISRMGLRRCAHCCHKLGVPNGDGAPYNQKIDA